MIDTQLRIRTGDDGIKYYSMNTPYRTNKAEEKRNRIIWALYRCLSEKGQERVSIKEIAAAAGLPQGVIHYYFTSKDDIISGLAEAMVERFSSMLEERLEKADPRDAITIIIDYIVEVLIFDRELNRVFYNLVQMTFERESLRKVMVKMFRNYREQMAVFFQRVGAGSASHAMSSALVAITEGFALQALVDPDSFNPDSVRRIIERGVYDILSSIMDGEDPGRGN